MPSDEANKMEAAESEPADQSPLTSSIISFGSTAVISRDARNGTSAASAGIHSSRSSVRSARTLVDGNMAPGYLTEDDAAPLVLERFYLWETASKFYVQGSDQGGMRHRILKIDKTLDDNGELIITQDPAIYTRGQVQTLLEQLRKGNASTGGCSRTLECFWGIIGFVRFTGPYYLITVKRRLTVAMIGGHYIYHSEETQLTPITGDVHKSKALEEARLMAAFKSVDLSKNFYYSPSYDLTNTLQSHFTHPSSYSASQSAFPPSAARPADDYDHRSRKPKGLDRRRVAWGYHDKFLWNHYLLESAFKDSIDQQGKNPWVCPLVYGFVDQSKICVFGRTVFVTLIARRSRHFAGARFLKRGVSEEGYVANEVEIEQIVSEAVTTALHVPDPSRRDDPGARRPNPRYTSYVQLRGSIPLLWHQDTTHTKAKPPIEFSITDPYFSGAAIHFDDLFARYGPPVICLNLIKTKERHPREAKLLPQFRQCLDYLAQFLPDKKQLSYLGFDMSAAQRSRQVDVTSYLAGVAEDVIERTRFFHSGPEPPSSLFEKGDAVAEEAGALERRERRAAPLLQCGVVRTNCIDCLDRTNAAQFCIGKAMLAHQLHALGILKSRDTPYESDAVNILTNMYHDLGDTIALQYGGSHLVNTIQTYRKTGNQYKSHARDTVEGLKRYYANTFSDNEKQAAINLFLGIAAAPSLNEFAASIAEIKSGSDDKADLRNDPTPKVPRRSYRRWFDPDHLVGPPPPDEAKELLERVAAARGQDGYFNSYYRPWLWTALEQHFGSKMNSTSMFFYAAFDKKELQAFSDNELETAFSPFRKREEVSSAKAREFQRSHGRATPNAPTGVSNVARWLSQRAVDDHPRVSEAHRAAQRRKVSTRLTSEAIKAKTENGRGPRPAEDDRAASDEADEEVVKVAKRSMRPTVKQSELSEYDQYIHQFDALQLLETDASLAHTSDLPIYEKAMQLASSRTDNHSDDDAVWTRFLSDEKGVDPRDSKIYADAVKVARGTAWSTVVPPVREPLMVDGGQVTATTGASAPSKAKITVNGSTAVPTVRLREPTTVGLGIA